LQMGERALTVRDRIIVHLSAYTRFAEDFECPADMCQSGISAAVGKSRAHITLELGRMMDAGLLNQRMAHVKGARSKRKTYSLTATGMDAGRQITEHLKGLEIAVRSSGQMKNLDGCHAADVIVDELAVSRVVAFQMVLACDGIVDLDKAREEPTGAIREAANLADFPGEPDGIDRSPSDSEQVLDAHVLRANMASKKGKTNEALTILEEALRMFGSDPERSKLHYSMAGIFRKQGNYPAALTAVNRSLSLARESNDALLEGRCLMEKAMIFYGMGNASQSLKLLGSALDVFRHHDSQVDILRCELNLGIILRGTGDLGKARAAIEEALMLAEKTGLERLKAYALANLADVLNEQGQFSRAKDMGKKAGDIFRVLDEPLMLAASRFNLGIAQAGLGERAEAVSNLDEAISVLERNSLLASRTDWLEKYAAMLEGMGESVKARAILDKI